MTLRLNQMSNELFEELSKYYPILAVAPGEVKDKNAFFFSICNAPFTAIIGQDFYNNVKFTGRELLFKTEFLGIIHEFSKKYRKTGPESN